MLSQSAEVSKTPRQHKLTGARCRVEGEAGEGPEGTDPLSMRTAGGVIVLKFRHYSVLEDRPGRDNSIATVCICYYPYLVFEHRAGVFF